MLLVFPRSGIFSMSQTTRTPHRLNAETVSPDLSYGHEGEWQPESRFFPGRKGTTTLRATNSPPPPNPGQCNLLTQSTSHIISCRNGQVLSKGMVLTNDLISTKCENVGVHLQGAPSFRSSPFANFQVYGVAQPRLSGLKAILSIMGCRPDISNPSGCMWISTQQDPVG